MDNQFCKTCGQANFPNANVCTKCGNALNQTGSDQPNQNDSPPPTIMVNQPFQNQPQTPNQAPQQPQKKSKKMFWILGIVGVLLIFGIGILGIAGIGGYLYFVNQDSVVEREYPAAPPKKDETPNDEQADLGDDEPISDIEFPSTGGDDGLKNDKNAGASKVSNATLILFVSSKKAKIGSYLLDKVKTSNDTNKFPNRSAGVSATYKKGARSLSHNFIVYDSKSSLKDDFAEYKRKAKSTGKRVGKSSPTYIVYTKGGLYYYAFHNPDGGLHEFSSRNFKDLVSFNKSYFDVK